MHTDYTINHQIIKEIRGLKNGIADVDKRLDDLENNEIAEIQKCIKEH